jgi:ferric-dicitrate binding protein FerR (iron transport regulator)
MSARERDARVETEIAVPLREASPALDELHRARLASALEVALDREDEAVAAGRSSGSGRSRLWISAVGLAAAAALGSVIFFRGPPRTSPHVEAPVARAPAGGTPALLVPYREAGGGAPSPMLAPSTSLVALAGETARATIGTRVRVTLVGQGRLSVLPATRSDDVELALDSGRLLVDYDGHAGGTLRVRSPGAVTTVVGTLFAVEAGASGSRVAVARGRVRTEDGAGHVWQVAAGDSWTSAEGQLSAISDELAAALVRHEAAWASGTAEAGPPHDEAPSPPAAHPAAPAAPTRPGVDLEALYAEAEAAMRARALGQARRTLETITDADRNGQLGEAALLDLARLALADGDRAEARRALGRLPRRLADPALAETAAHLRCRAERSDDASDGGDPCGP